MSLINKLDIARNELILDLLNEYQFSLFYSYGGNIEIDPGFQTIYIPFKIKKKGFEFNIILHKHDY